MADVQRNYSGGVIEKTLADQLRSVPYHADLPTR
jgi:hypothetical protein